MLQLTDVCLRGPDQPEAAFTHRFAAGSICVVLGANRSGKTDLCRLIAGLATPATGNLSLDHDDLTTPAARQSVAALVYQAFVNYPNLNVAENIASPLRARRMPAAAIRIRVEELAERLQLADLLQRLPNELSGGQQQRLAIARALAKDAPVLLLDEPLVNLDFKLREALEGELRDLLHDTSNSNTSNNTSNRRVVIYTTTDPRDAFTLGDEVLLLADGHCVQTGAPIDVYQHPASLTAMDLMSDPGANRLYRDAAVVAVRPEHLRLDSASPAMPRHGDAAAGTEDALRVDMHITACETSGDTSFLHGEVEDRAWVARCPGMLSFDAGDVVTLSADARDLVRFP